MSAATRAAADGPVFVTDRGRPAFALLKFDDYHRLSGKA
ncbi:MAG: type II toxin-antitoxin system prevent-host-death family antitoxin, partial [Rhodoferax sp.]|nr:type II toxin-antitoxin system prevent-host-death family antitoxin [Rhodoferax sp.]